MAKIRRDVWVCDAPLCPVKVEDDGEPPEGFSGTVTTVGGSGCLKEPWFACKADHIEPAITTVAIAAQRDAWNS
jgi:hypothetical protein